MYPGNGSYEQEHDDAWRQRANQHTNTCSYRPDMNKLQLELASFVSENDLAAIQDIVTDMSKRIARFTQEDH